MEELREKISLKERIDVIKGFDLKKGGLIEIIVNNKDHKKKNDRREIGYFQELRNVDLCLLGSGRYPYLIYCRKKSNEEKNPEEKMVCVDHVMNIKKLKYKN